MVTSLLRHRISVSCTWACQPQLSLHHGFQRDAKLACAFSERPSYTVITKKSAATCAREHDVQSDTILVTLFCTICRNMDKDVLRWDVRAASFAVVGSRKHEWLHVARQTIGPKHHTFEISSTSKSRAGWEKVGPVHDSACAAP